MYLIGKKYTQQGRDRFGSAILVDDLKESLVDSIRGETRDQSLLVVCFILLVSKFLSGNLLGLVLSVPFYFFVYFLTVKRVNLLVTKKRALLSYEYKYPRVVSALVYVFVIASFVIAIRYLFPAVFNPPQVRMQNIILIFQSLKLSGFVYAPISLVLEENYLLFISMDVTFTLVSNIWFGYIYFSTSESFTEFNLSHVSEIVVSFRPVMRLFELPTVVIVYLLLQFFVFTQFVFWLFFLILIVYRIMPKDPRTILSIYGTRSRPFFTPLLVNSEDRIAISRAIGEIYGWNASDNTLEEYPLGLVPRNVVSSYTTGLQASLDEALRQSNMLGAIFATVTNSIVFIALVSFSIRLNPSALITVFLIGGGLFLFSIVFGLLIYVFNRIRIRVQPVERLMIGSGFVARYISPTLWVMRGSKMEGTKVQRGVTSPWFVYDRTKGFVVKWSRLVIVGVIALVGLIIVFWISLDAVNPDVFLPLLEVLFDSGLDFLVEKANAELSFFIIAGYIIWFIVQFTYPRLFARTRPALNLELESLTIDPIVMKDFEEHQDASIEFTKSIIEMSRPYRRPTPGRPGMFVMQVDLEEVTLNDTDYIILKIGENSLERIITHDTPTSTIVDQLNLSAIKGYPSYTIDIELFQMNKSILSKTIDIELLYTTELETSLDLDHLGSLKVKSMIINQKS